jgi:putative FmdB family regulatory protein
MPKYDYRCRECGDFEYSHPINESISECPFCQSEVSRIYSAVGVSFKGSGFYSTDKNNKEKK